MLSSRILYLILIVAVIFTNAFSEETSVFQIIPKTNKHLDVLNNLNDVLTGISVWKGPTSINKTVDLMVPGKLFPKFKALMKKYEFTYDILIPDVQQLLENATVPIRRTRNQFDYGHFGWTQFHTLDEIYNWLDHLVQVYPWNVRIIEIGKSYEGRPIKGVHLSFGQNKPGVFIEAGIHAREWISHTTATYLIHKLLTSNNTEVRQIAESYDWYIVPCVNPDGYVYTHIDPLDKKYRMWRKTRSPKITRKCLAPGFCYEDVCYGVDANRNWDFKWGGPGSSNDPCTNLYAGSSAFSEIEMKSLAQYVSSISNKLFAYISFHSYIEKLMFPYGHTSKHLDNYDEEFQVGREAVKALSRKYGTQFKLGNIGEILGGPASGGSIDWVKANLRLPFVYCYELRGHTTSGLPYGFIAPPSEIIPVGEEVVDSLVALLRAAGRRESVESNLHSTTGVAATLGKMDLCDNNCNNNDEQLHIDKMDKVKKSPGESTSSFQTHEKIKKQLKKNKNRKSTSPKHKSPKVYKVGLKTIGSGMSIKKTNSSNKHKTSIENGKQKSPKHKSPKVHKTNASKKILDSNGLTTKVSSMSKKKLLPETSNKHSIKKSPKSNGSQNPTFKAYKCPKTPKLHTAARAAIKQQREEIRKEKEKEMEACKNKLLEEQKRREEEELMKLRQQTVFKAKPIRKYAPLPSVKKRALTDPISPNISKRRRIETSSQSSTSKSNKTE